VRLMIGYFDELLHKKGSWLMNSFHSVYDFLTYVVTFPFSMGRKEPSNRIEGQSELLENRSIIFGNSPSQQPLDFRTSPSQFHSSVNSPSNFVQTNQRNLNGPVNTSVVPSPVPTPTLEPRRKTLILDLDETLVHSTTQQMFQFDLTVDVEIEGFQITMFVSKRPYLDFFLESVAKWYDVVVFTASLGQYASVVIDAIDTKRLVKQRFYRQSCTSLPFGGFVKDISIVNKPLSDVVIIDNSPVAYSWHRDNAIPISDWWGGRPEMVEDTSLLDLLPFLEALASTEDVRSILSLKDRAAQYTLNHVSPHASPLSSCIPTHGLSFNNHGHGDNSYLNMASSSFVPTVPQVVSKQS